MRATGGSCRGLGRIIACRWRLAKRVAAGQRLGALAVAALLAAADAAPEELCVCGDRILQRGDVNSSHAVDLTDVFHLVAFLYRGQPAPPCMNQADANNDGDVNVADAIYLLNWLYRGGPPPPAPGPFSTTCSVDNAPYPGCANDPCF